MRTRGHSLKLKGSSFRADKKEFYFFFFNAACSLFMEFIVPLPEVVEAKTVAGF